MRIWLGWLGRQFKPRKARTTRKVKSNMIKRQGTGHRAQGTRTDEIMPDPKLLTCHHQKVEFDRDKNEMVRICDKNGKSCLSDGRCL